MTRLAKTLALTAVVAAAPSLAFAHGGGDHVHGLMAGLEHPVGGLDHLLAMVAVGVIAAGLGGRAALSVPLAFMAAMAVGALAGMNGVAVPMTETGIALSLVVLGAIVAAGSRLPLLPALALVGVFGLLHGAAHGGEVPAEASGLTYAVGFLAMTGLLHAAGVFAGLKLRAQRVLLGAAGAGTAGVGLMLMAQGV